MGQNAFKSAIFYLLDFIVFQPFANANIQLWKIRDRLVWGLDGEKAFVTNVSSSTGVWTQDLQIMAAFLTDVFSKTFSSQNYQKAIKKRDVNLLALLWKNYKESSSVHGAQWRFNELQREKPNREDNSRMLREKKGFAYDKTLNVSIS